MDFIERIFHLAPDGGNGLTEWGVVLVFVCAFLALAARMRNKQGSPHRLRLRERSTR